MIRNTTDFGGRFLVVKSMETKTTAVATTAPATAAITTTATAVAKTATATADPKTCVGFVLRLL